MLVGRVLLTLGVTLSCLCAAYGQVASSDAPTAEEYQVYNAAISKMFAGGKVTFDTGDKVDLLVIRDDTTSGDGPEPSSEYLKKKISVSQEAFDAYTAIAARAGKITRQFETKYKYVLFSAPEYGRVFEEKTVGEGMPEERAWNAFYKRYPNSGGFISFSRVGFDKNKIKALVYLEHNCGYLCASGHYVALTRTRAGWKVTKTTMAWIS